MSAGRTPHWNPASEFDNPPWREAVFLSSQDRLTIPNTVWRATSWLADVAGIDLAFLMDVHGHGEMRPWEPDGAAMVARIKEEIDRDPGARAELILALQDRCIRLYADKSRRVVLPPNLVAHLELNDGRPIHILAQDDRVEIASDRYREENWRFAEAWRD